MEVRTSEKMAIVRCQAALVTRTWPVPALTALIAMMPTSQVPRSVAPASMRPTWNAPCWKE